MEHWKSQWKTPNLLSQSELIRPASSWTRPKCDIFGLFNTVGPGAWDTFWKALDGYGCTFIILCECKFHRLTQSCIWVNNSARVWMPNTVSHPCLDEAILYITIRMRIGFKWSVQSSRLWTCPIACQPILSLTNGPLCAGRQCALDFFARCLSHIQ